jgi:hypothetical protein
MRTKLLTFSNGNETSLDESMPEVQRQFNQLHGELKSNTTALQEGFTKVHERFDTLESTRGDLATGLVELGNRLGGVAPNSQSPASVMQVSRVLGDVDAEIEDEDYKKASMHLIRIRDIDCVDQIYYEFKGKGMFQGSPIVGGLEACDARWKTRWRRHFNKADQKRFSRMGQLAKAIDKAVSEGGEPRDVLAQFDTYFRQKNRSFCGLIATLQAEGYLDKKAPRTKRSVAVLGESPGEGGGGG